MQLVLNWSVLELGTKVPLVGQIRCSLSLWTLEYQLNDDRQQLTKLQAGQHFNTTEGQLATQQSQPNEHLEALHLECNALHEVTAQATNERDNMRWDVDTLQALNQRLKASMCSGQPVSVPDYGV